MAKRTKKRPVKRSTQVKSLQSAGDVVDQISVELSYQIIRHFSAGLYTSPNKAIEELVANSYDAWADRVHVVLSDNLTSAGASICVVDNGDGMDLNGFRDLWIIGESGKRQAGRNDRGRPPIGKFGIGKLATYVLAKELTYVSRKGGKYRAVTMDFTRFEDERKRRTLTLEARELRASQAKEVLDPLIQTDKRQPFELFGSNAQRSWTVAVLRQLTPMAQDLATSKRHLSRVLETALPLSPQFSLFLNGQRLKPTQLSATPIAEWTIGVDDKVADELKFDASKQRGNEHVLVPGLGKISGEVQLFADPLTTGKSKRWGRSHGFFVLVRKRLINLHQELFGLEALSHGTWSRFRMVVEADGLDEYLRSTREDVAENEEGVLNFRTYLKAKFNEARSKYLDWQTSENAAKSIPGRISSVTRSLTRKPLVDAIRKVVEGQIDGLFLTRIPNNLSEKEQQDLVDSLTADIDSTDFFKDVRTEPLGVDAGLAVFDAVERAILINSLHPYFANYEEHYKTIEPFQLLAITEVLTEGYLLEADIAADDVREVLVKRDRLLRELVFSTQLSAPLVAQLLNENRSDWKGLEEATCAGFSSLGFEVSKISGKGKPDGMAVARIGVRSGRSTTKDYTVIFDSKSTAARNIAANKIVSGTIDQHRDDYNADYAVVVAPGFQGAGSSDSNAIKQATKLNITLITVSDLARLVIAAATRPLPFTRIRDQILENCRGPSDIGNWIDRFLDEDPPEVPLKDVLDVIFEIMGDSPDPPTFSNVADRLRQRQGKFSGIRESDIRDLMTSVMRFERDLVTINNQRVFLEQNPEIIAKRVLNNASGLPRRLLASSIFASLIPGTTKKTQKRPGKRKK